MHLLGSAFQNETTGQTLCQTWARLESKVPSLLFRPSSLNGCRQNSAVSNREVASVQVAVLSPSSRFTTITTGDTSLGIAQGDPANSPHQILPSWCWYLFWFLCPSYHRMLSGSGTVSFYTTFYLSGMACSHTLYSLLCFFSLVFLVWPLQPICLVATYTLKSKYTMADTQVSLPPTPTWVFFWDGKTGLSQGTTIVSRSCGL